MKLRTLKAHRLGASKQQRLDAHYYLSPGVKASEFLEEAKTNGVQTERLGEIGKVWSPSIFKRVYAAEGEPARPYLRPYDIFDFLPSSNSELSIPRTAKMPDYEVAPGTILQTCSGRNLGPLSIADKFIGKFVLSHDMVRIEVEDPGLRFYVLSYLKTPTGQELLKRDKSGSVIDHITADHVSHQEIPILSEEVRSEASSLMRSAYEKRELARMTISSLRSDYESRLPGEVVGERKKEGWTVRGSVLKDRIDAAYYDPQVKYVREAFLREGGLSVGDVATVIKPKGRYKTNYVDEEFGRPLLSGSHLLQEQPIKLKYMAPRAFKDVADYELREGWIAYPADGRADQALGTPVLITANRDRWLASGHVGRIIPNEGVDLGWLYLALSTWQAQIQIKAACSGSVVDSTYANDMASVVLPPQGEIDGATVVEAWAWFDAAERAEAQAVSVIELALEKAAGVS